MGHTYRGPKSGCKMVTLFGGYSYEGVSAGIWVIYTRAIPCFGGLCEERLPCFFYFFGGGVFHLVSLAMFDYIWCFLFLVCSIFQVAMGKLVSLQRAVTGWRIEARRLKL